MGGTEHRLSTRYPELQHFASRKEADRAVIECNKQLMKMPKFWVGLAGYTCGIGVAIAAILFSIRPWIYFSGGIYGGIVGGITGGSGVIIVTWLWRHRIRRFLRQQLVAQGVPICLKCGYDVRGQTEPRCPECGTPFDAELLRAFSDIT